MVEVLSTVDDFQSQLAFIESQHKDLIERLIQWSHINSGSYHPQGVAQMADAVCAQFSSLGADCQRIDCPDYEWIDEQGEKAYGETGPLLLFQKRPEADFKVLFCGHLDTVFPIDSPFQTTTWLDDKTLNGPGVADMKGGILVIWAALMAFEQHPLADKIGWSVILNPDEEIGSKSSVDLLVKEAKRHDIGLVYEPALDLDGTLASARKGVGSFTLVVKGKSAHAGRAFYEGRNAICALAKVVGPLAELSGKNGNITVNIGTFHGGTVANVVPDLAQAKINVRIENDAQGEWFEAKLAEAVVQLNALDGIEAFSHGYFTSPPKPLTSPTQALLDLIADTAKSLGQSIQWHETGGACDGNKLAKEGLPTVDSLGVVGADIHSDRERVLVDSLVERAKLSALLLVQFARGVRLDEKT